MGIGPIMMTPPHLTWHSPRWNWESAKRSIAMRTVKMPTTTRMKPAEERRSAELKLLQEG